MRCRHAQLHEHFRGIERAEGIRQITASARPVVVDPDAPLFADFADGKTPLQRRGPPGASRVARSARYTLTAMNKLILAGVLASALISGVVVISVVASM